MNNPNTFLYATGPITSLDAATRNLYQTYTVTRIDRAANRRMSEIWLAPGDGRASTRQLSGAKHASHAHSWAPDGEARALGGTRSGGASRTTGRRTPHLCAH